MNFYVCRITCYLLFDRKNEPIRMRTVQMILERNNVATILVLLA